MKQLIVVEGPAGSGKSTLCSQLSEALGLPHISRSMPTRDPSVTQAALESSFNDHYKLVRALMTPNGAIVDRCTLSQHVYGVLRGTDYDRQSAGATIHHLSRLVQEYANDLMFRLGQQIDWPEIQVILLLPPTEVIEKRRSYCQREFPWSAQMERDLYSAFSYVAPALLPKSTTIKVVDGSEDDTEELIYYLTGELPRIKNG